VAGILPVQAPLVADAGQRVKPQRIRLAVGHAWRALGAPGAGMRVAPGEASVLNSAARGLLPLRLGGKTDGPALDAREPVTVGDGLAPRDADHGLLGVGEVGMRPPRRRSGRRRGAGGGQKARVLGIGHRIAAGREAVEPHAMARPLGGVARLPAHPEPARRDLHHLHGSEYNRRAMNFADRMTRLGTESAFEVLARAKALERQAKEIVHLEIGEPDFDTPAHIRDAAKRALDAGATHYGPAAGLPELREAIAKDVGATRGMPVELDEIVVTPGAKPIMYFVITALVNPGDEVIYPNPGFPIYESVINFVGGKGVPIPLREESGFGFDMELFEKKVSARTKLIVINSPQNPTGGVLDRDQLGRIAAAAKQYRIPVLTDEIYKSFLYEGEFASITAFPGMKDLTIILDGFSKSY